MRYLLVRFWPPITAAQALGLGSPPGFDEKCRRALRYGLLYVAGPTVRPAASVRRLMSPLPLMQAALVMGMVRCLFSSGVVSSESVSVDRHMT